MSEKLTKGPWKVHRAIWDQETRGKRGTRNDPHAGKMVCRV